MPTAKLPGDPAVWEEVLVIARAHYGYVGVAEASQHGVTHAMARGAISTGYLERLSVVYQVAFRRDAGGRQVFPLPDGRFRIAHHLADDFLRIVDEPRHPLPDLYLTDRALAPSAPEENLDAKPPVVSHRSALRVYGVADNAPSGHDFSLSEMQDHRTILPLGSRAIINSVPESDQRRVFGMTVTSPARTLVDLASDVHPHGYNLGKVAHSLLKENQMSPEELVSAFAADRRLGLTIPERVGVLAGLLSKSGVPDLAAAAQRAGNNILRLGMELTALHPRSYAARLRSHTGTRSPGPAGSKTRTQPAEEHRQDRGNGRQR